MEYRFSILDLNLSTKTNLMNHNHFLNKKLREFKAQGWIVQITNTTCLLSKDEEHYTGISHTRKKAIKTCLNQYLKAKYYYLPKIYVENHYTYRNPYIKNTINKI